MVRTRKARGVVWAALAAVAIVSLGSDGVAETPLRIRIGTLAPRGSLWEESLQYLGQEWRKVSGGAVQVTVYPGGILGDESELARQVREGRLQAAGLSSIGLSRIDEGVSCLQLPMLFESYDDLDYVRVRLAAELERRIEARGFKVLHWADGGWVHTFTRTPAKTPDDVRRMTLFAREDDAQTRRLYREFRFRVRTPAPAGPIAGLQAGTVDAFSTVPLLAAVDGSYRKAPHMIDVAWMPLVGATVISQDAWDAVPAAWRQPMLDAARAAAERLRRDIRAVGDEAVRAMERRGLTVTRTDAVTRSLWKTSAVQTYSALRGTYCPADLFDQVMRLRHHN
jgi:TRAP-type C4-dicarboxylate transport system substrate-binding protein